LQNVILTKIKQYCSSCSSCCWWRW